jgi:anthranilate phosphoribosyltransferase
VQRPPNRVGILVDQVTRRPLAAPTDSWRRESLLTFLADSSTASDDRWRRWCSDVLYRGPLLPADLLDWWTVISEFDPVLGEFAARPIAVPDGAVIVAGSGKEQFKRRHTGIPLSAGEI